MRLRSPTVHRVAAPGATAASRSRSRRNVLAAAGLALALAPLGCTGGKGQQANAQSPERQSDAEYDIARDLFQKGNPRPALDHVQKSLSFNEENDKAHYLKAAILLAFCSGPNLFDAPDCRLPEVEKSARAALK